MGLRDLRSLDSPCGALAMCPTSVSARRYCSGQGSAAPPQARLQALCGSHPSGGIDRPRLTDTPMCSKLCQPLQPGPTASKPADHGTRSSTGAGAAGECCSAV